MKAYVMRDGVNSSRGKIMDKGSVARVTAFSYMTRKQEGKDIAAQQACPFSLEPCCEAIVSEKKEQRQRICPFTLEAAGTLSMSYCPAGS